MMNRVFNFSAGPSMLPVPVLEKAASEMLCYGESGMSVMEMSHRSPDYEAIINDAEKMLRELMQIPDNYKVLFLQGGASTQFAAVPMNLIGRTGKADYVVSGQFSGKAYKEAQKMGYDVKCVASSKEDNFDHIPAFTKDMILTVNILKGLGTPLSVKCLMHTNLSCSLKVDFRKKTPVGGIE